MQLNHIDEGRADYETEREESAAREGLIRWSLAVIDPCCRDCGYLDYARDELRAAHRRARAAGVFDDQPGEAEWLTAHRLERPIEIQPEG